jgi:hypothetical protein
VVLASLDALVVLVSLDSLGGLEILVVLVVLVSLATQASQDSQDNEVRTDDPETQEVPEQLVEQATREVQEQVECPEILVVPELRV